MKKTKKFIAIFSVAILSFSLFLAKYERAEAWDTCDSCSGSCTIHDCRGSDDCRTGACGSPNVYYVDEACPPNTACVNGVGCVSSPGACGGDLCDGVQCNDYCSGTTLYHSGSCSGGQCDYKVQTNASQCMGGGGGGGTAAQCNDGADNDGDGVSDEDDPDCHTDGNASNPDSYDPTDNSESGTSGVPECQDVLDNDSDGIIDADDPDCHTDGNASNPNSYDPNDDDESGTSGVSQCNDGEDNDGDGLIDSGDPDCHTDGDASNSSSYDPTDNDESGNQTIPQCSDDIDNDSDGFIDTEDPDCHTDGDASNPDSYDPDDNNESWEGQTEDNPLSITKTPSVGEASVGDEVTYTVRVTNVGQSLLTEVLLRDGIPAEMSYVAGTATLNEQAISDANAYTNGDINILIGNLNPGQTVVITYRLRIDRSGTGASITNVAMITANDQAIGEGAGEVDFRNEAGASIIVARQGLVTRTGAGLLVVVISLIIGGLGGLGYYAYRSGWLKFMNKKI